jgi:methionyl-tRNA formyltransferase
MRIVFMGSPDFAVPTLERLIESQHELAAVVSQPDRPAGRGRALRAPPAKELARRHSIPVLQPERVNSTEALDALRTIAPDAIVIAAYGQILKQPLLDIPMRGSLNIHASLLPRWRGAAPAAAAILAGDERTGVSIQQVVLALDAGPVLAQTGLPIEDHDTTASLNETLSHMGADLLIDVLPAWERGDIERRAQDDTHATYAPSIRREDAKVDWSLPATDIWRRVRAFNPWPVAFTSMNGEVLRILKARPLEDEPDVEPGTVTQASGGFGVRCGRGTLAVLRAQRAGRRAMSGAELLRGAFAMIGKRLGE